MSDSYFIRPWQSSDEDALLELYQRIFPAKNITRETITHIANEPATVYVAQEQDKKIPKLIAFLYYWSILDEFQIIDIGVLPEKRRQGLAAELLWLLIERAAKESKTIQLEVRVSNLPAIALYERAGFAKAGFRRKYYADGEDAYLYAYFPGT